MSGAAQQEETLDSMEYQATGTDGAAGLAPESASGLKLESASGLKLEVAARLAAHRSRRGAVRGAPVANENQMSLDAVAAETEAAAGQARGRRVSARVRETVAARYEQSVSYREFLAAEAERALEQAQAEAEVAVRSARAVAEAQMELLEELKQWDQAEASRQQSALEAAAAETVRLEARGELAHALADIALGAQELIREPVLPLPEARRRAMQNQESAPETGSVAEVSTGGLTVRLYEDIGPRQASAEHRSRGAAAAHTLEELDELEQEIEFRRSPEFEPLVLETTPIPGNLIEFPRQLIAPRKARPRLAEGPLREDGAAEPQLRIFEVEAEQISTEPEMAEPAGAPEWQSLLLGASRANSHAARASAQASFTIEPEVAPLELRLMAAAVDAACLLGALLSFAVVVVEMCGPRLKDLPLPLLGASAAGVLFAMYLLYQMLFFSISTATPGMRYARIGLCTFTDSNPSRKAMRRRVFATLLAACPLGLGLAWAFLDDERLGWHDRMSRMYQRSY